MCRWILIALGVVVFAFLLNKLLHECVCMPATALPLHCGASPPWHLSQDVAQTMPWCELDKEGRVRWFYLPQLTWTIVQGSCGQYQTACWAEQAAQFYLKAPRQRWMEGKVTPDREQGYRTWVLASSTSSAPLLCLHPGGGCRVGGLFVSPLEELEQSVSPCTQSWTCLLMVNEYVCRLSDVLLSNCTGRKGAWSACLGV